MTATTHSTDHWVSTIFGVRHVRVDWQINDGEGNVRDHGTTWHAFRGDHDATDRDIAAQKRRIERIECADGGWVIRRENARDGEHVVERAA